MKTNVVVFPGAPKPVDPELQRYKLPKVQAFRDRLGRIKAYGRSAGFETVTLTAKGKGYREFLDAYGRFMASVSTGAIVAVVEKPKKVRIKSNSVRAAIDGYKKSDAWKELAPATAGPRARILRQLEAVCGDESIGAFDTEMIQAKIDEKPVSTQKNWRSAFRGLFKYARAAKMIPFDVSAGIKAKVKDTKGFRTWTETEIAKYLAVHHPGTMARRTFLLGLNTAQRRGDLSTMGWKDIVENRIKITQSKTGQEISIPVFSELAAELAFVPEDAETFLVGDMGKRMQPNQLSNKFHDWLIEAGLPVTKLDANGFEVGQKGLSIHGLRRAMCRRLVRCGMTYHQIKSITGHKTLSEVQRYCEDYENEIAADEAMAALEARYGSAAA